MADESFRGLFKVVFRGTITVDLSDATVGSGTFGSATATVNGVLPGDHVVVIPATADTAGAPRFGDVSAANTVRVTVLNNSAGDVNYASQAYKIVVMRPTF